MSAAVEPSFVSIQEYLDGEERSEVRHEYVQGRVYAMSGATDLHSQIVSNLVALLRPIVRGSTCRVFSQGLKVRIDVAAAFYYPDVFVACDPRDAESRRYKSFPKLVVEVLSPSTAAYDLGEKFRNHQRLESLEEYVVIDSERFLVNVYRREPDGRFRIEFVEPGGVLELQSIGAQLPAELVYEDVVLGGQGPASDAGANRKPE